MLVAAAADRWNTTPDKCRTEASVVHGPNGQSATYAELASDAARKPVPANCPFEESGGIPARRQASQDDWIVVRNVMAR